MVGSILKVANVAHDRPGGRVTDRVVSAWRSTGRPGRVGAVGALAGCALVVVAWPPASIATGLTMALLVVAAVVDVVERRLPDVVVGLAALPVVVAVGAGAAVSAGLVRGVVGGAALLGGPLLAAHLVSPAAMGFGDVKAGIVLGAALGLVDARLAVVALVLGLTASAGWAIIGRRRTVALGPGLVAGALGAVVLARVLGVVEVGG